MVWFLRNAQHWCRRWPEIRTKYSAFPGSYFLIEIQATHTKLSYLCGWMPSSYSACTLGHTHLFLLVPLPNPSNTLLIVRALYPPTIALWVQYQTFFLPCLSLHFFLPITYQCKTDNLDICENHKWYPITSLANTPYSKSSFNIISFQISHNKLTNITKA